MIRFLPFLCFFSMLYAEADFVVLTIPKSGTHMMLKLLPMLTEKRLLRLEQQSVIKGIRGSTHFVGKTDVSERLLQELCEDESYIVAHFQLGTVLREFTQRYPRYKKVIVVRDLRDVVVSYAHWLMYHPLPKSLKAPKSLDKKLMWIIQGGRTSEYASSISNIYRHGVEALRWMQDSDVYVVRFEDLCGEKGGGSEERQREVIQGLADHLDISMTDEKLEAIIGSLWGETENTLAKKKGSFRKGKIGSWKGAFTSMHIGAFKRRYGELQKKLGYLL